MPDTILWLLRVSMAIGLALPLTWLMFGVAAWANRRRR
jgi:hypothetical protein